MSCLGSLLSSKVLYTEGFILLNPISVSCLPPREGPTEQKEEKNHLLWGHPMLNYNWCFGKNERIVCGVHVSV